MIKTQPFRSIAPPLHIYQVPYSEYPNARELGRKWEELTSTFKHQNKTIQQRMEDAGVIAGSIEYFIAMQKTEDPRYQLFICEDARKIPQAMMLTKETNSEISVEYLVSCPWNIHPIGGIPNYPVKGAGTSLMMHVFQMAMEKGTSVELESYLSAQSFYEQLGFTHDNKKSRGETSHMYVLAERIAQIYPQYFPPQAC